MGSAREPPACARRPGPVASRRAQIPQVRTGSSSVLVTVRSILFNVLFYLNLSFT